MTTYTCFWTRTGVIWGGEAFKQNNSNGNFECGLHSGNLKHKLHLEKKTSLAHTHVTC